MNRHNKQTDFIYNYKNGSRLDFIKRIPKTLYFGASSICQQSCLFCHSKDLRHKGQHLPFNDYIKTLDSFKKLGLDYEFCALAGGGEPMLYKDGDKDINDQIISAYDRGYKVFIISAENDYSRITKEAADKLHNLRISFTRINEKGNKDKGTIYNFGHIPESKICGSYIMYDETLPKYDYEVEKALREKNKREWMYEEKTTNEIIDKIFDIHIKYPFLKNTRISPDYFLIKENGDKLIKKFKYRAVLKKFDISRFEIDTSYTRDNRFSPYRDSCIEGIINTTIHPKYADGDLNDDGSWIVSWCRQHVFNKKTFDTRYENCKIDEIESKFKSIIDIYLRTGVPHKDAPHICTMCCAAKMQEAAHNVYKNLDE